MKKNVNNQIVDVPDSEIEPTNLPLLSAGNCNGNACPFLNVGPLPTGGGMRFSNNSDKPIHISIEFAFGLQCMSPTTFTINPNSFSDYGNGGYCNSIQANF
ncbi:MAG TPA: hypothetical protein VGN20_27465 [Mucilaginibacter sp.]|jgi:hypothetical protein